MVILATNMEKVEEEKGIDEVVADMASTCRRMDVPLVYSMNRYRLGCLSKFKGQNVSAVGIMNFQGANEEFNRLSSMTKQKREEFYEALAEMPL